VLKKTIRTGDSRTLTAAVANSTHDSKDASTRHGNESHSAAAAVADNSQHRRSKKQQHVSEASLLPESSVDNVDVESNNAGIISQHSAVGDVESNNAGIISQHSAVGDVESNNAGVISQHSAVGDVESNNAGVISQHSAVGDVDVDCASADVASSSQHTGLSHSAKKRQRLSQASLLKNTSATDVSSGHDMHAVESSMPDAALSLQHSVVGGTVDNVESYNAVADGSNSSQLSRVSRSANKQQSLSQASATADAALSLQHTVVGGTVDNVESYNAVADGSSSSQRSGLSRSTKKQQHFSQASWLKKSTRTGDSGIHHVGDVEVSHAMADVGNRSQHTVDDGESNSTAAALNNTEHTVSTLSRGAPTMQSVVDVVNAEDSTNDEPG